MLAIALACGVSTLVPQEPEWTAQWERFAEESPAAARAALALGLNAVLQQPWFLVLIALAAASLTIVQIDQWRRFARVVRAPLDEAAFGRAPFRRELLRPRRGAGEARYRSRGRIGMLGTPLFHLGLLLVVLAGAGRALFGREASVELIEGEPLKEWPNQWGGPLSWPLPPARLQLVSVGDERHLSGGLRRVLVMLTIGDRLLEMDLNSPVTDGPSRLALQGPHGPAALVELSWPGGSDRRALLLREGAQRGLYLASARFATSLELRLRAAAGAMEARVLQGAALLYAGPLEPGSAIRLAGGQDLVVRALPRWATLRLSRDAALPLAFAGFVLVVLGAVLMFAVVRVDTAVVVRPAGESERVLVALRPQRFAPLYRDAFEKLVLEAIR